jgi:hypothetical protein
MKRELSEMERIMDSYRNTLRKLAPYVKKLERERHEERQRLQERDSSARDLLQQECGPTRRTDDATNSSSDDDDREQALRRLKTKLIIPGLRDGKSSAKSSKMTSKSKWEDPVVQSISDNDNDDDENDENEGRNVYGSIQSTSNGGWSGRQRDVVERGRPGGTLMLPVESCATTTTTTATAATTTTTSKGGLRQDSTGWTSGLRTSHTRNDNHNDDHNVDRNDDHNNDDNDRETTSRRITPKMSTTVSEALRPQPFTDVVSSTATMSMAISVDSLSNTALRPQRTASPVLLSSSKADLDTGYGLQQSVDVAGSNYSNNNNNNNNNNHNFNSSTGNNRTWSVGMKSQPATKSSKYGVQYIHDDEDEDDQGDVGINADGLQTWSTAKSAANHNKERADSSKSVHRSGMSLSQTAPALSTTPTTMAINNNSNNNIKRRDSKQSFVEDPSMISVVTLDESSSPSIAQQKEKLNAFDQTQSSLMSDYNNDTFDTPDFKRARSPAHEESLIYSDSKQWPSDKKTTTTSNKQANAEAKRRPSYKEDDEKQHDLTTDSDVLVSHFAREAKEGLQSIDQDIFISSAEEESRNTAFSPYIARFVGNQATDTAATDKSARNRNKNNYTNLNNDNSNDDSQSSVFAIDTSKSVVIDVDIPVSPNTFESRGTPHHQRFRRHDDFDVDFDEDDVMNLGTMTSTRRPPPPSSSLLTVAVGGEPEQSALLSDDSSLNYTYSAPPTRELAQHAMRSPAFGKLREQGADDAVLLGTSRLPTMQTLTQWPASDTMERDSLAGTLESVGGGVAADILRNDNDNEDMSPFRTTLNTEDSALQSTTNLSVNSKGGLPGEEDMSALGQSSQYVDETFEVSASPLIRQPSDEQSRDFDENASDSHGGLVFAMGRAPLDLIELAKAFEVHLSGVLFFDSLPGRVVSCNALTSWCDARSSNGFMYHV